MGADKSQITAVTLNYSGIYLSPFEYYGIDNWQELEKVGRIFEEELKRSYDIINEQTQRLGGKPFKEKEYNRKAFSWDVGKIDKDIQRQRYTPVYAPEEMIERRDFAGIIVVNEKQSFMSQAEFQLKWHEVFDKLAETNKTAREAQKLHRYHCCMFDFLCFKSIALYLNHHRQNENKIFNFQDARFWNYQKFAEQSKQYPMQQTIELYKEFMTRYFARIHIPTKRDLTMKWLFQKNQPSTVSFTEATPAIRAKLQNQANYFMFGPPDPQKTKQTIVMVKKSLPFIPSNYNYKSAQIDHPDSNEAIKKQLEQELKRYSQPLVEFWKERLKDQYKQKQQANGDKWINNLTAKNFLHWTQDLIFTRFVNGNDRVIIAGFHLSSKTQIGQLQGQLLGLMIYHLVENKGYKFIFSGDFNSYITVSEKDDRLCVFQFAKFLKFPQQKVRNLFNTVSIYPKHPKILTTKKKRTILQVQTRKVNELAEKCIDQIISNYPIDFSKCHVGEIMGIGEYKNNYSSFLPHKNHPYDHFCVESTLSLKQIPK